MAEEKPEGLPCEDIPRSGLKPSLVLAPLLPCSRAGALQMGLTDAVTLISKTNGATVELKLKRDGQVISKSVQPKVNGARSSIGVQMAAHVERWVELVVVKAMSLGGRPQCCNPS